RLVARMCRFGSVLLSRREALRSSLVAEPAGSRCRWLGPAFRSSGSSDPQPCSIGLVLAPYGVLQSLLRDRDLVAALASVSRVLKEGGLFGLDLVPDVPNWREYRNRIQLRGRAAGGAHLTLVESVRQDR